MKKFTFGKYKGETVDSVIEYQPSYVMWALQNVPFFTLSDSQNKKLSEKYSEWKFYHTNECKSHRDFKEVHDDLEAYAWGGVLGAGYE
jgi:hypothetical protein